MGEIFCIIIYKDRRNKLNRKKTVLPSRDTVSKKQRHNLYLFSSEKDKFNIGLGVDFFP